MITYVVDLDDMCDVVAPRLAWLDDIKERYPQFKCTLFTIPNRTSDDVIKVSKERPWIALAPHGWHHTRGECLTWPYHEALTKITQARSRGIDAPAFRAPAWLINRATYEACRDLGITVCDHRDQYLHLSSVRVYRYNDPSYKLAKVRSIHGHMTQCGVDNYLRDMLTDGRMTFAKEATWLWPWEAAVELGDKPLAELDEAETHTSGEVENV